VTPLGRLSDRTVVVAALGAVIGALHPARWSLIASALAAAVALVGRRAAVVPLAVALLVSGLADRSLDGLDEMEAAVVAGEATLVGDPTPSFEGLRVDVRLAGRRLEARADGASARALADRLAGEVVRMRGELRPTQGEPWLRARHVSGRLTVLAVEGSRPGDPVAQLANGLRRTLVAGTTSLDPRERSLFTGLVLGDDRHQPVDLADAFRGAGLTHLLAVSGQNVAFALALVGPVLRRLRLWPRLLVTLAVIALFGVMTRFEPSVLRASAMAALAATLAMAGRPVARVRVIAMAVTGLLIVDPLLIESVGFRLSVCAAAAIVIVAPSIAAALPGPAGLRDALAVTLAAQIGVAPVLLGTFGPIPVAAVPANLLAVPVAGLVMVWGLTAGMVAGAAGDPLATLLHGPTQIALDWLELVASRSSRVPLGELGSAHVAVLAVGLGTAVVGRARCALRRAGWALVLGALLVAVVTANAPVPLRSVPLPGVVRWHSGGTDVVVLGGVGGRSSLGSASVLAALRRCGVDGIDLLVVADASVRAEVVEAVQRAHPSGAVVAHRSASLGTARPAPVKAPTGVSVIAIGGVAVRFVDAGERLVVEATARAP
jgi:competence protein ComEC